MQKTAAPTDLADQTKRVWLFHSTEDEGLEANWVRGLKADTVHFWGHNSTSYTKQLMRGDAVVMSVGDLIVALGTLLAGGEWAFHAESDGRRWPILIEHVLAEPLPVEAIERGERIFPHAGAVQRLGAATVDALRSLLVERGEGRVFRPDRSPAAVEADAALIAAALQQRPDIRADAAASAILQSQQADGVKPQRDARLPLHTDAPATEDRLDRAPYALFLARRMDRIWLDLNANRRRARNGSEESDTFILHVDAPWGGGKSTFANFLARTLQPAREDISPGHFLYTAIGAPNEGEDQVDFVLPPPENAGEELPLDREWVVARYNAWRDQNVQPPWWQIFCGIETAIKRQLKGPGAWWKRRRINFAVRAYKLGNSKVRTQLRTLLVFAILGALVAAFSLVKWGTLFPQAKGLLGDAAGYSAIAAGIGFGGAMIAALVTAFSQSLSPDLDFTAESKQVGVADPVSRFRTMFDRTLQIADRPVLLIVDDIDRCDPKTVVEVMRGFQTVVRSSRLFVLLLGDRNWIEAAHDLHYQEMKVIADRESGLGAQFVRKVIQLSFRLPLMSEDVRQQYTRFLLAAAPRDSGRGQEVADVLDELKDKVGSSDLWDKEVARRERDLQRAIHAAKEQLRSLGSGEMSGMVDRVAGIRQVVAASENSGRDEEISEALAGLFAALPNNPRQMKRIVSAFSIYENVGRLYFQYRQTPVGEEGKEKARRWRQLAVWVTLATEWPETWRALARRPELIDLAYGDPATRRPAEQALALEEEADRAAAERLVRRLRAEGQLVALLRNRESDCALDAGAIYEFNRIIWEPGFRLGADVAQEPVAA
jgi:hypothetical protein